MSDLELVNCRHEIEERILRYEQATAVRLTGMEHDLRTVKEDVHDMVTKIEFAPVRLISFGLAGGTLIAALGAILARVLGW